MSEKPESGAVEKGALELTLELSAIALDYLRTREMELTRRAEIAAARDVQIEKIRNFAQIMIAAVNGAGQTRDALIAATSEGIRDAIAAGNSEVALELSRVLASLGSLSETISLGFAAVSGRRSIEQA